MEKICWRSCQILRIAFFIAILTAGPRTVWAIDVNSLPSGGTVTSGNAAITSNGSSMTVTQNSDKLITQWDSFNIGRDADVRFIQPGAGSAALNRIFDQNPTQILGQLQANGQIFLLNPAGIIFGQGSQVNVGGLVASSLNMTDDDFLSGNYRFTGGGFSGGIGNLGEITTSEGGIVALIGSRVANEGTITTPQGTTALIAGEDVTLDFVGDGLINYSVEQGAIDALAENDGLITADGGMVLMTANAADELTSAVVNNEGVIEARTIGEKNGRILLLSDMEHGETIVGGRLDASAPNGGDGGFIETSAAEVRYQDGFFVTAGAAYGTGGLWLIDPADAAINQGIADGYATTLNTGTSVLNEVAGNITLNNGVSIAKTAGGDATLTFKATGNIILEANSSISSATGALHTVLWADSDADGGYISIGDGSAITTNGGHLWMGGGSGSTTWNSLTVGDDAAWGIGSNGFSFGTGTINTGVGNISVSGKSNTRGLNMWQNVFIDTTSGNVELTGTSTGDIGLMLQGPHITTVSGDITVTGSGNAGGIGGVHIENNAELLSTSGDITIDGTNSNGGGYGIRAVPGDVGGAGSSSDILLKTDSIALAGQYRSSGTLTIENKTAGTAIAVGIAFNAGDFNLTADNFSTHFVNGFSGITVGSATAGDITVDGATDYNDPLTLKTADSIAVNEALTGVVAQNAGLVLWADADADADGGYIGILNGSSITTNGGHLWLGGGSGSTTWNGLTVGDDYAAGIATETNGIFLDGTAIASGGGNIAMYGKARNSAGAGGDGSSTRNGIHFSKNNNVTINSGTGTIYLEGDATAASGATQIGIQLNKSTAGTSLTSAATSGNAITMIGYGGSGGDNSNGLQFQHGALSATGGGNILMKGTETSPGTWWGGMQLNNAGTINAGSGNLTLQTDTLDLSHTVSGSGQLIIQPVTADKTISLGTAGSSAGPLSLTAAYFATKFTDGFSSITVGSATAGAITVGGAVTASDDLTLQNNSTIAINGTLAVNDNLVMTSSGAISQTQALDIAGTTTITAGSSNNITLTNTSNDFSGEFSVVSGAAVSVKDANSITLGDISMSGDLTAEALSGNLLLDGDIAKTSGADATATLKATGYVTLADSTYIGSSSQDPANGFTSSIVSSNNKLNVVINPGSGGGVGGFWLPNGSSVQTNGGNITIGGGAGASSAAVGVAANSYEWNSLMRGISINGTLDAQGGNITMIGRGSTEGGVTAARGVHIGGTVSTEGTGAITITGTPDGGSAGIGIGDGTAAGGPGSIIAEDGDITLIANDNTGAAFQLYSATSLIRTTGSGNLDLTSNGSFTGNGIFDIGGTTTLTAGTNTLSLTNSSNDFTGAISVVSAGTLSLIDSNAFSVGAVSTSGTIDIASLTGNLTLTGAVSTTNATASAVTLNAGKNTDAGTATGGNIIINGGSVSVGAGGTAKLYSGSVSGSTGLTTLIGSGSGKFRYNSDESAANYTTAPAAGKNAIYREQPTITVTAADDSTTYDGSAYSGGNGVTTSGFVNGDTSAILGGTLAYGGSSQGAVNAGTYAITPSGHTNGLGYGLSYVNGTLTVNQAALLVTAVDHAKNYDGLPYAGGNGVSYTGFAGSEDSSVLLGSLSYSGSSQGAVSAGDYIITPGGLTSSNYALTFIDGTLTINSAGTNEIADVLASALSAQHSVNGTQNMLSDSSSSQQGVPDLGPGRGSTLFEQNAFGELIIDRTGYRDGEEVN